MISFYFPGKEVMCVAKRIRIKIRKLDKIETAVVLCSTTA
jgi:hypothetical protein